MPRRNLIVILVSAGVFLACYAKLEKNRFASAISRAISLIQEDYVRDVNQRDLFEAAMQGMVGSLDEYSEYITPRDFGQFQESLDQKFGGVGIVVEKNAESGQLVIASPLVNTPAWRAGIHAGDIITEIEGQSTHGMSLEEAVRIMRGPPGAAVAVTLRRTVDQQEKILKLSLKRAIIPVESVLGDYRNPDGSWNYHLQEDSRIGYIRLTTFGDRSLEEIRDALRFKRHDVDALILDLRDNAGGYLTAAIDISDLFIDRGVIVTTRGRDGAIHKAYRASRGTAFPEDKPLVVLVNKYSASASEILAACLQDHRRAVVVGERSWGKGTVQNIFPMESGESALKITVATYWRPSGKNIHKHPDAENGDWGVQPNPGMEVPLTDKEAAMVMRRRRQRDILFGQGGAPPAEEISKEILPVLQEVDQGAKPKSDAEGDLDAKQGDDSAASSDGDDEAKADDAWKTFDDPQLRRAIEHLQSRLDAARAA